MLKQLRGIKRCIVDVNNPLLTANVSFGQTIYNEKNPYRKHSNKHKQFAEIQTYFQQHNQPHINLCSLTEQGVPPAELWKEARLGHLHIDVQYQASKHTIPVSQYFDNVRSQWTQLLCYDHHDQSVMLTFTYEDHSSMTIHDMCCTIEKQCVQYTPYREDDDTWSFLLYDSNNKLLNQTTNMHTKWWSKKSFLHHSHDFTKLISLHVSPNQLDKDIQHDLNLVGNRKTIQTPDNQTNQTKQINHNQNESFITNFCSYLTKLSFTCFSIIISIKLFRNI